MYIEATRPQLQGGVGVASMADDSFWQIPEISASSGSDMSSAVTDAIRVSSSASRSSADRAVSMVWCCLNMATDSPSIRAAVSVVGSAP